MKKKIKLEFFDRSGIKHSIAIEGEVTPDKVNRLLEYAEIVGGAQRVTQGPSDLQQTKMNKLIDVINTRLPNINFDSRDLLRVYNEVWGEDFTLGAMATYLSRLADRGTLERMGSSSHWVYRLKPSQELSQ